jgi:tRNA-dihydrouridine synthase 3
MEHWGSDSLGVESTRRFLCEWLSFTHRYVPVGILERGPQRMNDRPPAFVGRDELETWMGSAHAGDWVRLTELVLGPAPATFKFVPKHRSNSYEVSE